MPSLGPLSILALERQNRINNHNNFVMQYLCFNILLTCNITGLENETASRNKTYVQFHGF